MGYHVTILRTRGEQAIPITLEEAAAIGTSVPGWRYDEKHHALVSTDSHDSLVLWHSDGELWTKNPEGDAIAKMLVVAGRLGARVRGEEFETYRTPDETYTHPDDAARKSRTEKESRASSRHFRRRQWLFNAILIGAFLLIIFILKRIGFLE